MEDRKRKDSNLQENNNWACCWSQLQQVSRHPWWYSLHSRQFDFKWAPGPFLPLFIAKFWSRYNTSISTPNQSLSLLWIRCFNARHRSSNPVSARKTLTTAPPKFVQRLITARAKLVKQRWFSVQDFCVGLADPSVRELLSSGAKLWLGVVGAYVNFAGAENCPLLTARNILCSSKLSER